MTTATLAFGYAIRRPTMDDLAAVYALEEASDLAEYDEPDVVEEDVRSFFQNQRLDEDTWLVANASGQVAAYAGVHAHEYGTMHSNLRVHPEHRNRGIGTYLLGLLEARAQQLIARTPTDARVTLSGWIHSKNLAARRFAEK